MRVTLRLSDGLDSDQGLLKVIDLGDRPFLLGRSPEADWTLHDPSSRISGTHLELRRHGEDLVLKDLSSGGTGLNSAANRLQRGQPTRLPDECKLVLPVGAVTVSVERADAGAARMQAREDDDFFRIGEIKRERGLRGPSFPGVNPSELLGEPEPEDTLRPRAAVFDDAPAPRPAAPAASDGAAKLMSPGDLLGGAAPVPLADPEPLRQPSRTAESRPRPAPLAAELADAPPPSPVAPSPSPARKGSSWLDDEDEDDDPFGAAVPEASPEPEPAPDPEPMIAAQPAAVPTTTPPKPAELASTPQPEQPAALTSAPNPAAELAATPPVQDTPHAPASHGDGSREALDAIFTQLGIPTDLDDTARLRMAMEIGATFAAMADAMRQMLATRAEVKRALGIVATEVEIGANPLKTARDRTAAIDGLVRPLSSGFLSGESAVEDSLHSMQSHQYAMVSGIKAALQKTLDAFDPATLEEKMTRRGLTSWLPGQHKAALWDSFVTNYDMFSEQAAENFRMLIGRELDNLYQTRRDQPPGRQNDT